MRLQLALGLALLVASAAGADPLIEWLSSNETVTDKQAKDMQGARHGARFPGGGAGRAGGWASGVMAWATARGRADEGRWRCTGVGRA